MLASFKKLGILGINRRVAQYILPNNDRADYPVVDDKVLTDERLRKNGLAMPENYAVIASQGDLRFIKEQLVDFKDGFVIKPASGSQGNGIVVIDKIIKEEDRTYFVKASGQRLVTDQIRYHVSSIISGLYSLSGLTDKAIIQEKLRPHPIFKKYSFGGIPDIRVIVFKGYPVMAMVRLPTKASDGKANLHQAAVGCGIDLKTGRVCGAVCQDQKIEYHPDTKNKFSDLVIPQWMDILTLSAQVFDYCPLGYMGVDIILDPDKGPMILEINARPGLSIQLANHQGLIHPLEAIEAQERKGTNYLARMAEFKQWQGLT